MARSGSWHSPIRLSAKDLGPAKVVPSNDLSTSREVGKAFDHLARRATARKLPIALRGNSFRGLPHGGAIMLKFPIGERP